jgi:predicted Fe-Mo cluster-binding NifX family protein
MNSQVDMRFGRARYLAVVDMDTEECVFIDNHKNMDLTQGAGIQSAENVMRTGAVALVTGHCGPKAFRVLAAAGIAVFEAQGTTVEEAVRQFKGGELSVMGQANAESHWV